MAHLKNTNPTLSHVLDMFKNQSQHQRPRFKNTKQSQYIETDPITTDRLYVGRFLPKDKYQCLLSPTLNLFLMCLDNMHTALSRQNIFNSHMHEEDSLVLNISVGEHDIDVNIDGKNGIDTTIDADIIENNADIIENNDKQSNINIENNDEINTHENDIDDADFQKNGELFDNDNLYGIDAENRNDDENEKNDTDVNDNEYDIKYQSRLAASNCTTYQKKMRTITYC